jgi:hypothetical protein
MNLPVHQVTKLMRTLGRGMIASMHQAGDAAPEGSTVSETGA